MIKVKDIFRKGDAVRVNLCGQATIGQVVRDMGHEFQVKTSTGIYTLSTQDPTIVPINAVATFNTARG